MPPDVAYIFFMQALHVSASHRAHRGRQLIAVVPLDLGESLTIENNGKVRCLEARNRPVPSAQGRKPLYTSP